MPELPEVETTLRGVVPHLVGRRITGVEVRQRRLRWPVPKQIDALAGRVVADASRRGKYLLFDVAPGAVILHLGMSGSLRVVAAGAGWRKHDHLALSLDSGRAIRFHDPRRFGCVLFCAGDPLAHRLIRDLGPEPLGDGFHAGYLAGVAAGRRGGIKQLLMDSRVVVGVGNIYACEALFLAGIHPRRAAGRVAGSRLETLVAAVKEVLGRSIEMGGTTLRDFLREDGEPGYFKQSLLVYGREGEPCKRCGGVVRRFVQVGRSTFYCPGCQR